MTSLVAVGAQAATAGHLGGGGVDIPVLRIVMSLIACLIIAVLAILFLRQRSGRPLRFDFSALKTRGGAIDLVEVRRLSLHGDVCVVRHDGREYLLLVQAGDSRVLRERDVLPDEAVAA
jgi:hypothetical protein